MSVQRWNFRTHSYEPYEFGEGWNCPIYSDDFDQIANCAERGTLLAYGNTFTSRRIHNDIGLGFGVCNDCYSAEWDAREDVEAGSVDEVHGLLSSLLDRHHWDESTENCSCGTQEAAYMSDHVADEILDEFTVTPCRAYTARESTAARIITTVEELVALPDLAVLIDRDRDVLQKRGGMWCTYETAPLLSSYLRRYLPLQLLWLPTDEAVDRG